MDWIWALASWHDLCPRNVTYIPFLLLPTVLSHSENGNLSASNALLLQWPVLNCNQVYHTFENTHAPQFLGSHLLPVLGMCPPKPNHRDGREKERPVAEPVCTSLGYHGQKQRVNHNEKHSGFEASRYLKIVCLRGMNAWWTHGIDDKKPWFQLAVTAISRKWLQSFYDYNDIIFKKLLQVFFFFLKLFYGSITFSQLFLISITKLHVTA